MTTKTNKEHKPHIVPEKTFIAIWAVLLALTGVLVGASHIAPHVAVWAMLLITPLKAGLVFYYFMHLKYEGVLLRTMVFVTLATLVVFIGLLFFDISFR